MNLELMAMRWLRFEKRCALILCERSPRSWLCGEPDVLGVTDARYLYEIEVKRTLSDFKADGKKRCRANRQMYIDKQPKQFYYLMPARVATKAEASVPHWAGLMVPHDHHRHGLKIVKQAPTTSETKRLTIKECVRMAKLLSNFAISACESTESVVSQWRHGHEPFWKLDYEI
jgi:hypothetical protein